MRAPDHDLAAEAAPAAPTADKPTEEAPAAKPAEKMPDPAPAEGEPKKDGSTLTGDDDGTPDDNGDINDLLGAPEGDYELEGLPEGTVIDTEALAALAPIAKEIGLSNAGMSKLAGVYAEKILPGVEAQFNKQLNESIDATRKEWDVETRAEIAEGKDDKGNLIYDGKSLKEVRQIAARAMDALGGEGLRKALEESGFGNHKEVMRFAYNAGKAIKEDTFERGAGEPAPKRTADKFYDPEVYQKT